MKTTVVGLNEETRQGINRISFIVGATFIKTTNYALDEDHGQHSSKVNLWAGIINYRLVGLTVTNVK